MDSSARVLNIPATDRPNLFEAAAKAAYPFLFQKHDCIKCKWLVCSDRTPGLSTFRTEGIEFRVLTHQGSI